MISDPLIRWGDFVRLADGDRRELVDGHLVETEVPDLVHERIVALLVHHLQGWVLPREAGTVLPSGYKVRISDTRGVMPDVQFLAPETATAAGRAGLEEGRPELVVEVVSPSSRGYDRVTKLAWYASIGVPEYWLVDPEARTLERLVLTPRGYLIAQTATEGAFRPESFEGLEIPVDALWAAA